MVCTVGARWELGEMQWKWNSRGLQTFFLDGWTIACVRSWTGLTLAALEYYVGLVDIARMGGSFAQKIVALAIGERGSFEGF